jgi:uncharacterized membrane protein
MANDAIRYDPIRHEQSASHAVRAHEPARRSHARPQRNWHTTDLESRSFGGKLADAVAKGMGSWTFIIIQTAFVIVWMGLNLIAYLEHWDPYPFILLNLVFSTQAAYAAPIIMQSQNRSAARDREQAQHDYETNLAAKEEIEQLIERLYVIEQKKIDQIMKHLGLPCEDAKAPVRATRTA